jgi:hypothetical protein
MYLVVIQQGKTNTIWESWVFAVLERVSFASLAGEEPHSLTVYLIICKGYVLYFYVHKSIG